MWLLQSSQLFALALLAAAKPVNVSLEAPWYPVAEHWLASETVSRFNSSSYFPMSSLLINERSKSDNSLSDEVSFIFDTAVKTGFLKSSSKVVAREEFALGTVIPVVQANFQSFESVVDRVDPNGATQHCPVIMWTEGKSTCDKTDLFALQNPAKPLIPDLHVDDRVIGDGDQWIVVYADLDSPEFPGWHEILLEMALSGRISYVSRYRPSLSVTESDKHIDLAGYAVSFDSKNTDYLVIDDRMNEGKEVELNMNADKQVPSSKIPALGYALARRVRNSDGSEEEKFEALRDIVFDSPSHMAAIASEVDDSTIDEEKRSNKIGAPGLNAAFLDGILLKSPDLFSFFTELHAELSLIHTLSLQVPEDVNIENVLTSGFINDAEKSNTKQRYNLMASGSAISWINDIEKDVMYEGLPTDVTLLEESLSPFAPIRRNMHSVVIAGDFNDRKMLAILYDSVQQMGQQIPSQIGIVSNTKEWHNVAKFCGEARQAFISRSLAGDSTVLAAKYAQEVNEDITSNPETAEEAAQVTPPTSHQEFYDRFGIDSFQDPTLFVNGFPLPLDKWMEMATVVFENDANYLRSLPNLKSIKSLRDTLYKAGDSARNKLLDPMHVEYVPWKSQSPIHVFRNPDTSSFTKNATRHSIVFASSFDNIDSFHLAEALLHRAHDVNDLDIVVRPLNGIDSRFYASLMDETYNAFRFSLDLFNAARGHSFEHKTEPRVFTVVKPPKVNSSDLPKEPDSLIVDGRYIDLRQGVVNNDVLTKLIDRETDRVELIQKMVPGIGGIGVAALSAAADGRTAITDDDIPDIFIDSKTNNISLALVVDPATTEGQKYMALGVAAKNAGLKVKLYLSPSALSALPKKHFQPVFDRHLPASFTQLSDDILYTAELVEPDAWMSFPLESECDPDNFLLNTVNTDHLNMKYSLHSSLIQGFTSGPRVGGIPLTLRSANGTKLDDTNIMSNLGYFQLQTPTPGYYDVCIEDTQKSFETAMGSSDCLQATSNSFGGTTLKAVVKNQAPVSRKYESSSSSFWSSLKSVTGMRGQTEDVADINIFTIASGHLYERFASIMMLSVMKNTKHSVKFWLVENFMSPDFKRFVPEMAKKYGFKYEFVSYKWPSWLRAQSEKQRQIWGYKILFLDVMFPQNSSNIIFVDSDQIVRSDFKDLLDIDLHGAPYAFTPMGDDREEMEPFRFWKQGFWKSHLIEKDMKYHISALYRVDLDVFRKGHIGDASRHYYQILSKNPENLANLDQDLPNYIQPIVPIYSLPDEWLWCETWCSDERLKTARTIDLCNNPSTKEPKLKRARRQIKEWTDYDDEVTESLKEVRSMQSRSSAPIMSSSPKRDRAEPNRPMAQGIPHEPDHDEL